MPLSLLIVDDDATIRETLAEFFETFGHTVRMAATGSEARAAAAAHAPDVAVVDLRLPDACGITLLEALRADDPELAVVVLTGHGDVRSAVRAMQHGAADFLEKPVDLEALAASVERAAEVARLRREVEVLRSRELAPAESGSVPRVVAPPSVERLIELAARNPEAPVLIVGETGTGKGWVARRIHERSPQHHAPFVEVNCASLTPTFVESELFGHERGAFTDAKQAKRGLLEVAGRGTVFLDEIGELAPEVQPRLLKAVEERRFRRLGGTAELRTEARLVAATNHPLDQAVASGRFRADLYYRLQVLTIALPPLRKRGQAEIEQLARESLTAGAVLSEDGWRAVRAYRWPGNVRELRNALWRGALLADGAPIEPAHLGLPGAEEDAGGGLRVPEGEAFTLEAAERRAIERALAAAGGNRTRAAQLLGISRSTLAERLKRIG